MRKQFYVQYESDVYNRHIYNPATDDYGSYEHVTCGAASIKTAKGYIRQIRKEESENNPRNFRIYDSWASVDQETNHVHYVYQEN